MRTTIAMSGEGMKSDRDAYVADPMFLLTKAKNDTLRRYILLLC